MYCQDLDQCHTHRKYSNTKLEMHKVASAFKELEYSSGIMNNYKHWNCEEVKYSVPELTVRGLILV